MFSFRSHRPKGGYWPPFGPFRSNGECDEFSRIAFTRHSGREAPNSGTVPVETGSAYGRDAMSRKVLIPLLAAAFLVAPAFAPAALPDMSAAHAVTHLNSSKSNIYRTKTRKAARATTVKGSKSNSSDRVNLNSSKSNAFRATTVKSSKSNSSD